MSAQLEGRDGLHFQALFEHTSDIAYVVDAECRLLDVNPAAERILGYSRADVAGWSILEFVSPDQRAAVEAIPRQLSRGGEHQAEFNLIGKTGVAVVVEAMTVPVIEGGRVTEFLGIARDVTKRRQAEQRVRSALDASNDFVAAVSHQLRTPLTVIKWSLELAADAEELPEDIRALVSGSRDSAEELIRVFNDLLNFSRVESGTAPFATERVDLGALTWKVLRELRWLATAQRHQITVGTAGLDTQVLSDPIPLSQVLQNLLGNAIKYTPPGGSINIGVSGERDAVVWSIADTGPGIPIELRDRLFERFVRAPVGPTNDPHGTGLGLYIVKRLIERLGGSVWVESDAGQGSVFAVRIPRRPPDVVAPLTAEAA